MCFDAKRAKDETVLWIRNWFSENGDGCNAVLGISGGKDSSIAAALCAEALGNDRVIGVLMPNGVQSDIDDAAALCDFLKIKNYTVNIEAMFNGITGELQKNLPEISRQTIINLPPRLRMAAVYAVSQSVNGRVCNTCNLSEEYIGYSTRYGDGAGDFGPIQDFTVQEVKLIGKELGLPAGLIEKAPADGLCGTTDEDNFGFTYEALDRYIRTGICPDAEVKAKIDRMHKISAFKREPMPIFKYYK